MDTSVTKCVFFMSMQNNDRISKSKTSLDFQVITDTSQMLVTMKRTIKESYWVFDWDKYKKLVNQYELIYTNGQNISNLRPVSRSFFKLHEILHDFQPEFSLSTTNGCTALFLADGPGGFIEAFHHYRKNNADNDKLFGVTLLSRDRSIPSWKIKIPNVTFLQGTDGTGSLYQVKNIDDFASITCEHGKCDFITADGGFDFSSDFNNQEKSSLHLILCEIYTAMMTQKKGGCFVIKMYDLFTIKTLQLLSILRLSYANMYITKPHTSRPANSEKYVVCIGFTNCPTETMFQLRESVIKSKWCICDKPFASVVSDIAYFNTFFVSKQLYEINRVVTAITQPETIEPVKKQIEKALRWCYKYNIPINLQTLHSIYR